MQLACLTALLATPTSCLGRDKHAPPTVLRQAPAVEAPRIQRRLNVVESDWSPWTRSPRMDHAPLPFGWLNPCQRLDGGLATVADWVLGLSDIDQAAANLAERLLMAGVPYPRARLLTIHASPKAASQHLRQWLAKSDEPGELRCGIAWVNSQGGAPKFAVVAANALFDIAPIPRRVADPSSLRLRGRLLEPATAAAVVTLRPSGSIARSAVSLASDPRGVSSRLTLDEAGRWHVQVVADIGSGPQPVAELSILSGDPETERRVSASRDLTPQQNVPAPQAPSAAAMLGAINQVRAQAGVKPVTLHPELSIIAQRHANAMGVNRRAVHVLDGQDAGDRLANTDFATHTFGENVARGGSLGLIHDALMKSPSHRANLLHPGFTDVGLGVHSTSDGSYWVCQLFAAL